MKVIKKIAIQAFCMASFPKPMTIELPSKKLKISTNNCVKDIFSFTISNLIPFNTTTVNLFLFTTFRLVKLVALYGLLFMFLLHDSYINNNG